MSVIAALQNHARQARLVIFAGAGLNHAPPAELPDEALLTHHIIHAVAARVQQLTGHPDVIPLAQALTAHQPMPDVQAHLIEEEAGTAYFEVLRTLDGAKVNANHLHLAQMAKNGHLKVIITRSFDRMLERACEQLGVDYQTYYAPAHFERFALTMPRLNQSGRPLHILKLRGTIEDAATLRDMQRQRRLGLDGSVRRVLAQLLRWGHWLFLGYNGADLDAAPDAFELRRQSADAIGFTWQTHAPQDLARAVHALVGIYGARASIASSPLTELLAALVPDAPAPVNTAPPNTPTPPEHIIKAWANQLGEVRSSAIFARFLHSISPRGAELTHALYQRLANTPAVRLDTAFSRLWRLNIAALVDLGQVTTAWDDSRRSPTGYDGLDDPTEWMEIELARILPGLYGGDVRGALRHYTDLFYHPDAGPVMRLRAALGMALAQSLDGQAVSARDLLRDLHTLPAEAGNIALYVRYMFLLGELEALTPDGKPDVTRQAAAWLNEHSAWLGDMRLTAHSAMLSARLAYRLIGSSQHPDAAEQALDHIDRAIDIYRQAQAPCETLRATLLAREVCLRTGDHDSAAQLLQNAAPLLERFPVYRPVPAR